MSTLVRSKRAPSKAYKEKNNNNEARNWLYKAISEAPYLREAYVELAQLAYLEKDWPCVFHMVEEALKIKERPASHVCQPFAWDFNVYDLGALSCYELGMYEKSYHFAMKAIELSPKDERLKNNLKWIKLKIGDEIMS